MLKKFHEAALDEIYVPGSNEEVFSGRLLKVQRDHVTLPNGNDTTREYIRHPGAVAIVPVLADGSVVLVSSAVIRLVHCCGRFRQASWTMVRRRIHWNAQSVS